MAFLLFHSCGEGQPKLNGNAHRDSLQVSLNASLEANELTQPPNNGGPFQVDSVTENTIITLLSRSVTAGESVDDRVLAHFHEDLPTNFKDYFLEGNKRYLHGIKNEDVVAQLEGNALVMRWAAFWEAHKDEILDKMYPSN